MLNAIGSSRRKNGGKLRNAHRPVPEEEKLLEIFSEEVRRPDKKGPAIKFQ